MHSPPVSGCTFPVLEGQARIAPRARSSFGADLRTEMHGSIPFFKPALRFQKIGATLLSIGRESIGRGIEPDGRIVTDAHQRTSAPLCGGGCRHLSEPDLGRKIAR